MDGIQRKISISGGGEGAVLRFSLAEYEGASTIRSATQLEGKLSIYLDIERAFYASASRTLCDVLYLHGPLSLSLLSSSPSAAGPAVEHWTGSDQDVYY